jgi:hypothetical protein
MGKISPFPTITKLAKECKADWKSYAVAEKATTKAEKLLKDVLNDSENCRILDADLSLVLCGSFARYEMVRGSDYDWTLLVNGVVSNKHAKTARNINKLIENNQKRGIISPGSSGTFGNMCFSHDLVHRIGGGADSNENLTRRILMLLESRPVSLSSADSSKEVWSSVIHCILERYFEEDVHFSPTGTRKVPRFLLNDLTRYWRTIGVDYAAKHLEQDGRKWAIRNAKLRMSRKLLYAAGMAFCFACQLQPPGSGKHDRNDLFARNSDEENASAPFIAFAAKFAGCPPLEFLAAFVKTFVIDRKKREKVSLSIFGSYDSWLSLLEDDDARSKLENLSHSKAKNDKTFQRVREIGSEFASGLKLLFFDRDQDFDPIADLSLEYVGF